MAANVSPTPIATWTSLRSTLLRCGLAVSASAQARRISSSGSMHRRNPIGVRLVHLFGHAGGQRLRARSARAKTIKLRYIATLFALGAIGAAITTAADASAAMRSCADSGGATTCQSPGKVEIHAVPPVVQAPHIYGPFASPIPFLWN